MFFLSVRLQKWWREIFPSSERLDFRFSECPMLIGVVPEVPKGKRRILSFADQCRVLLSGRMLPPTGQRSTPVKVLETLRAFREEWRRNQMPLVAAIDQDRMGEIDISHTFDFGRLTRLCPDVVVEISKYLWLDQTIGAFSMSILPLLRQTHTKVHLNNPSKRFLKMIVEHLDPRQIISVRVDGELRRWKRDFSPFQVPDRLISLALVNLEWLHARDNLLDRFQNVRVLSLWFNGEFDFDELRRLRSLSSMSITRLHIRCVDHICAQFSSSTDPDQQPPNSKITSFIFDSVDYRLPDENCHHRLHLSELFTAPIGFIQSLVNVRNVRFITNRFRIETLLQVDHWQQLMRKCVHLERLIIHVRDHAEFTERVQDIEKELRQIRPGMIFRIKSV